MIFNLFKSLSTKGNKSTFDRAHVHSLEGDIYLLELESNGVSEFVEDDFKGRPKRYRSLYEAKQYAKKMNIERIEVALNTPYDQMIGLASCS